MSPESEAFEKAVTLTIEREGKPSDVKGDKGGATKYGISQRFLQSISDGPVTSGFVMGLSLSDAKEIYRNHFWYRPKIHKIPSDALRECVFDQGVNRGASIAVMNLQAAVTKTSGIKLLKDGILGPKTIDAIYHCSDKAALGMAFIKESQLSYARLVEFDPSQAKFIEGWIARTWYYF